jgi:hypothetical protein
MQRELQSYQDEGGEKVSELKQELALVRSQLEESKERQELAERQSGKTEQVIIKYPISHNNIFYTDYEIGLIL